jgi:hypothetical protein
MSDLLLNAELLAEPELEFASGQQIEHPATGLALFGPVDSKGIERPNRISYAVIGSPQGISGFEAFAACLNSPIRPPPEVSEVLWPNFPGYEEAIHAVFPKSAPFSEVVSLKEIEAASNQADDYKRVFDVTNLYLRAIKALARKDTTVDLTICVVPEIIYKNCRPLSKVTRGTGKRPSTKEVKLRRQTADLFQEYDSLQYDFSLDFRRQIKARAMEYKMPIQIIRESTMDLSDERPPWGRTLTPLSDRAWNLSTALYYKSGRKPWKLPSARDGVCYVGIAFKRTDEKGSTACSAAQMFLDDGDGIVFLGDYGPWYSPELKQCHLSRSAARGLLAGVLKTYEEQHGKKLSEVFLHCRSATDDEEWQGYQEACPKGVKLIGIRVAPDRRGLRAYRSGTRPVVRGTFWKVSERVGYLWASGFKPVLRTYDGWDVPEPLRIEIQHGEADIKQVTVDIFGLTKLNYNTCKLGESQPVTVHFSDAVGEILVANKGTRHFLPNFKYYV